MTAAMTDPWAFWHAQLAGKMPETTPGTPKWGYYRNRRRETFEIPLAERKVGGSRKRAQTEYDAVAIWQSESGAWLCLITRPDRVGRVIMDPAVIDEQIFCRCCRDALTHEQYLEMTKEQQT